MVASGPKLPGLLKRVQAVGPVRMLPVNQVARGRPWFRATGARRDAVRDLQRRRRLARPQHSSGPGEYERITAILAIAQKAADVGLAVFALGEHRNPPLIPSSPATTRG